MRRLLLGISLALLLASPALAAGGEKGDWEMGLYGGWIIPDDYEGLDPDQDFLFGGRIGYFFSQNWSLETSYQRVNSDTDGSPALGAGQGGFEMDSLRLNLLYNFGEPKPVRWFATLGFGAEDLKFGEESPTDLGLNLGGGLRWSCLDWLAFRGDARYVMTRVGSPLKSNENNLELMAGVSFLFGGEPPADTDGDGVNDRKDDCPNTPKGARVDAKGCPIDTDGDGVADGLDRCPDTPKGWAVDAGGCPVDTDGDGVPDGGDACPNTPRGAKVDPKGCPTDADGDGVFDGLDRCPDTPRGTRVDASGCPVDSDGDGVHDGIDACPNTPRGAKVDPKGCPTDADGDGVFDGLDRCPDTPAGRKVDAAGCPLPEAAPAIFQGKKTLVLEGVNFESSSAKLTETSKGILDKVADSLDDYPNVKIEVAGHTDSTGSASFNEKLSQKRAEAVRDYLVGKGVSASQLTAKGYGPSKPVADNGTKEGRAQNRRVELARLD